MKWNIKMKLKLLLFITTITFLFVSTIVRSNTLQEREIVVDGISYTSFKDAEGAIKDYSAIYLGPGIYKEGLHIRANNVWLTGDKDTHFVDAAIENKAAIIVSGQNVTIETIECSDISVYTHNGACIRQQAGGLTLRNVYFHDSEQGVLQAHNTGDLTIEFSRFERLGQSGRAHAVYSHGSSLTIRDSIFLASKDQGHEIKSRSKKTIIENSLISSQLGDDSRLIDISDGGVLSINNSILHQGINSVNRQVIGFGLENLGRKREQSVIIENSLIVMERPRGNEFLAINQKKRAQINLSVNGNIFVGSFTDSGNWQENNRIFNSRSEAQIPDDKLPEVRDLVTLLRVYRALR